MEDDILPHQLIKMEVDYMKVLLGEFFTSCFLNYINTVASLVLILLLRLMVESKVSIIQF